VEVLVTGRPEDVGAMVGASHKGPPGARVAELTATPDDDDGSVGFTALPTE